MRTFPTSPRAATARALVEGLQHHLVATLTTFASALGHDAPLQRVSWLRDEGRHGGGERYELADTPTFGRASANVSVVHYDDLPEKRLGSATALSCIVHPRHPVLPSLHLHLSWTELRSGSGYWRIMADLNPSLPREADTEMLRAALRRAAPELYEEARAQGDRYFWIPALARHRGVLHYYLEGYDTGDWEADAAVAERLMKTAIDTYGRMLDPQRGRNRPSRAELDAQRAYHTLYFFQVLTLDRGTTAGLLVHDQNDPGILGSLPPEIDRDLLAEWRAKVPSPQEQLIDELLAALPPQTPCPVRAEDKPALARVVRRHYRAHPEALKLQASGGKHPPTIANHR